MIATTVTDNDDSVIPIMKENERVLPYNDFYVKIPHYCNIKDYLKLPVKTQAAVLLISRSLSSLPLKDIKIQMAHGQSSYQFGITKHKTPYMYKYMPEIIDMYPLEKIVNPGIAVFCFPEGIKIKQTYDMPKWFNFVLTDESGSRTYGSALVFTEELSTSLIESFVPIYKSKESFFVEKAICVLSNYPFFYNCRIFLRELYRIQVSSSTNVPLERAICHFVDSLYFQNIDKILSFTIAEEELKFYRVPIYGNEWDVNDECIEVLFSLLSYETILTVWEGLLLEKKVFLLCSSKSALLNVSMALISLLFPFRWMHVLVPILPEKLKVFIESPVPLLIGLNYAIDINDLPSDSLILNIEKDSFENYIDKLPKLPPKLLASMMKKLNKIKVKYNLDNPVDAMNKMSYLDEVFPSIDVEQNTKIDTSEIRDIFYEFFVHMFKNYEKYFIWKNSKKKENNGDDESVTFLREVFLKDHSSTKPESFLYTFSETSIFTQFEDTFKYIEPNSPTSFFLDSIKKGRGKTKYYLPNKIPSISSVISEIKIDDLKGQSFFYKTFPNLDSKLYIQSEIPRPVYHSRFVYTRDEWCFDPAKLSNKDWGRFLMYTIYEIWFTFFSFVIHFYDDKKSYLLMEYAMSLIDDLINRKKIQPSKNLFTKLIKSCGRKSLNVFVKPLLNLVSSSNTKNINALFHNAFMNGLYAMTENIGSSTFSMNNSLVNSSQIRQSVIAEVFDSVTTENLENKLIKNIFLSYELCPYCLKHKKNPKKIIIEEIFGGFSRGKSDYSSLCPSCLNKIFPKLYFVNEDQLNLDTETANFLSPLVLVKEVDNIIKNHGEKYFYQEDLYKDKYHRHIFWNIAFYFQVFDLPLCVMYVQNNEERFLKMETFLEESKARRIQPKKASTASRIMNKSADNNVNNIQNETMSKKYSSTSNDLQSVSCRSGVNNLPKYEKELWKGIQSRIERTTSSSMMSKYHDKNPNEDRGEVNARIYDIKQILSRIIDNFVVTMKSRLEKFLNKVEYNDIQNNGGSLFTEDEGANQNMRSSAKTVAESKRDDLSGININKVNSDVIPNKIFNESKKEKKEELDFVSEFNLGASDKKDKITDNERKIEDIKDENFISNTNFNQESQNSKPFFLSGTSNSKMDTFSHIASGFGNKTTLFNSQKKKVASYKIKLSDKK